MLRFNDIIIDARGFNTCLGLKEIFFDAYMNKKRILCMCVCFIIIRCIFFIVKAKKDYLEVIRLFVIRVGQDFMVFNTKELTSDEPDQSI